MAIYGTVNPKYMKGIVDSALVGMDVTDAELERVLNDFKKYPESSVVVVNFHQIELANRLCKGSHVAPCIVIAYPPVCSVPTEIKVAQAKYAVEVLHAPHVLFTIDHSKFAEGKFDEVQAEISAVVKVVNHRADVIVMPDFTHWTPEQCVKLAEIIRDAGADIIKSTGGLGRAEDPVKIAFVVDKMKRSIRIMATSAIRNIDDVLDMMDAKPDKIAISRFGFFQTYEEVYALEKVRLTKEELARKMIGLVWHPTIKTDEVKTYLEKAKAANLFAVSVDPRWVPLAKETLKGSGTKVIARVDHPLGLTPSPLKIDLVKWVVANGPADMEVQVPMNTAMFKTGDYDKVREELDGLVAAAAGRPLSVILQTPLLSKAEIAAAALLCAVCGVTSVEPVHGFGKFTPDGKVIHPDKVDYHDVGFLSKVLGDKAAVRVTGAAGRLIETLVFMANGAEAVTAPNVVELLATYDDLVERIAQYQ